MNTKITIVTPSLNQASYINQTIQSVINQKYSNIEYFIYDGKSDDGTAEIIQSYQSEIAYWESCKDKGQSNAINKGIMRSSGHFVGWINSDDYYNPNSIQIIWSVLNCCATINCVIGKIKYFYQDKPESYYSDNPIMESVEKTAGYGRIPQAAMFFSKEAYNYIGLLNENLHYCMDLEWWIKYLLVFGVANIGQTNQIIANFRMHSFSKTVSQNKGFEIERDSIYYSIAKQLGLERQANTLYKIGKINESYCFIFPCKMMTETAKKMIDYFLLLRGDEFYAAFERNKAFYCFSSINAKSLSKSDKKYFYKLMLKNLIIPSFVIKMLKKL